MTAPTDAERIHELEEDNRRLRRLLDQRDAPGELRHRLRSTLALLRSVVRRSAKSGRDLPGYVGQLEDRLDAIDRAQSQADRHGGVELRALIADELFQYGAYEGERVWLSGPDVWLHPRAGQVLALAMHELAVNAVEHGALGAGAGRVVVAWTVTEQDAGRQLSLTWDEADPRPSSGDGRQGFGMEVLTRMLPYELKAETALAFAPAGLHCSISMMIPERTGRTATQVEG